MSSPDSLPEYPARPTAPERVEADSAAEHPAANMEAEEPTLKSVDEKLDNLQQTVNLSLQYTGGIVQMFGGARGPVPTNGAWGDKTAYRAAGDVKSGLTLGTGTYSPKIAPDVAMNKLARGKHDQPIVPAKNDDGNIPVPTWGQARKIANQIQEDKWGWENRAKRHMDSRLLYLASLAISKLRPSQKSRKPKQRPDSSYVN